MFVAWGIHDRVSVERIGDYIFKMEFVKEDEKGRVIQGGPKIASRPLVDFGVLNDNLIK
jgi:hypothetical protein